MVNGAPMVLSDAALNERILRNLLTDLEERLDRPPGGRRPEEITSAIQDHGRGSAAKCPAYPVRRGSGRW